MANPTDFIPTHYTGESLLDTGRLINLTPFHREVFTTSHRCYAADFEQYEWLLRYGDTDTWYTKPTRHYIKQLARHLQTNDEFGEGPALAPFTFDKYAGSHRNPRVWAAPVLTAPTDDDVYDCEAGHSGSEEDMGSCRQCTDEKSDALDRTPLSYHLVLTAVANLSTYNSPDHNGQTVYKLVKCGSREAAIAEAFYNSGANGWSLAFSCVMRTGETFEEKPGAKVNKVDELWEIAEEEEEENVVKVFY